MKNPFADPRCTCSVSRTVTALLEEREPELCTVHQADALAALEAEHARADAQQKLDTMRDALDQLRLDDELARRRRQREEADAERERALAALAETDPLLATLHRMTNAALPGTAPPSLPLNAPLSAYPALAGMTTHDDDGPDAA